MMRMFNEVGLDLTNLGFCEPNQVEMSHFIITILIHTSDFMIQAALIPSLQFVCHAGNIDTCIFIDSANSNLFIVKVISWQDGMY